MAETNGEFVRRIRLVLADVDPFNVADLIAGDLLDTCNRLEAADKKIEQQQNCIRELKELLKTSQCPDILYCHNGFYVDTQNNTKHPCKWCEPRKQALAKADEMLKP